MKVTSYSPGGKEHRVEVPEEPIFEIATNSFHIGYGLPKIKSHLKVGSLIIHNTHHFNWFHRMMWRLLLGFEIENVKEN